MAKKTTKTKEAPPSLQNGAIDAGYPADSKIIIKILMDIEKEELSALDTSATAVTWLSKFVKKYFQQIYKSKTKQSPGQQLKLAATNTHDDLMEILVSSQAIAEKFYSSLTIKSGTKLRKVYLVISKKCLAERKVVLNVRGKKREINE